LPVDAVRAVVPASLELDTWDGLAWVGLVPFRMQEIRAAWMPRATGLNFLETNLRTYVHHRGQPGVFFFSLEASSWIAVRAARIGWGLPYFFAQMQSRRDGARLEYSSVRSRAGSARLDVKWELGEVLGPSRPGSLEFFLLERYLLYAERGGRLKQGQVHHPPYPAQRATLSHLDEGLLGASGIARPPGSPAAVHCAEGVDVEVFGPWAV
jgi:uncharacterized protein